MPNPRIEALIADALRTGRLVHPGDPANNVPPKPIALPFQHRAGQPQEMTDLMDETVKVLSEAIVSLIETDSEIVPRDEAEAMRHAVADEGLAAKSMVPLYCRCDRSRSEPLAILRVTNPDYIVVDGPTLIRGLSKRTADCPHEREQ